MSNELESLYQQVILDHAKVKRGLGRLESPSGTSRQVNISCGDEVDLDVQLSDGKIEKIGWEGHGCSISQASLSVVSELLAGKSEAEAADLIEQFTALMHSRGNVEGMNLEPLEDAVAFTGVAKFPARVKCALLGWMAAKDAIAAGGGAEGTEND
ncbi:MAG: SUF system NifU family Fe-S cluster assembly protein [Buchananella hordeovulneris]|nr:SUF system NifU family Fe-S cluster assembly protein [Buchananella hordeovulneris]